MATAQIGQREFMESLRSIVSAAGIGQRSPDAECFTIGVTGPSYSEGKTTVAMAVAGLIASDFDVDVALIDTDFETHSLGREYEIDESVGIADVLAGRSNTATVMRRVPNTRLDVVTSGALPSDPGHLIRSGELSRFIEELKAAYAFVILDLPGMLPSSSGRTLAGLCDGVIVITKAGTTTRVELDETLERLSEVRVLGIVINRWQSRIPRWLERAIGLAS